MGVCYSAECSDTVDSKQKINDVAKMIPVQPKDILDTFKGRCQEEFKEARRLWKMPGIIENILLYDQISYGKNVLSSVLKLIEGMPIEYKDVMDEILYITNDGFYSGMTIYSQHLDDDMRLRILELRDNFWQLLLQAKEIVSTAVIQSFPQVEDNIVLQALEALYPSLDTEKRRLVSQLFVDLGKKEKAVSLSESTGEDVTEMMQCY